MGQAKVPEKVRGARGAASRYAPRIADNGQEKAPAARPGLGWDLRVTAVNRDDRTLMRARSLDNGAISEIRSL
jgi:hypothetical protein